MRFPNQFDTQHGIEDGDYLLIGKEGKEAKKIPASEIASGDIDLSEYRKKTDNAFEGAITIDAVEVSAQSINEIQDKQDETISSIDTLSTKVGDIDERVKVLEEGGETPKEPYEYKFEGVAVTTNVFNNKDATTMGWYDEWAQTEILPTAGYNKIEVYLTSWNSGSLIIPCVIFCKDGINVSTIWLNKDNNDGKEGSYSYVANRTIDIPSGVNGVIFQTKTTSVYKKVKFFYKGKGSTSSKSEIEGLNTVCIGDSVTRGDYGSDPEGTAHTSEYNYPYFFEKYSGAAVTNLGVNGATAISEWNYIQGKVNADTDIVIIMLGLNSAITDTLATDVEPYSTYSQYANTTCGCLCKIIEYCYEVTNKNANIFLCSTTPAGTKRSRYRQNAINSYEPIQKIAKRYGIPFVDNLYGAGFNDWNQDLFQPTDNLHFGYIGYQRLAQHIFSQVKAHLNINNQIDTTDPN